jgi:hypothetical protein
MKSYNKILNNMINTMNQIEGFYSGIVMASEPTTKNMVSSHIVHELYMPEVLDCRNPNFDYEKVDCFMGVEYKTDLTLPFGWVVFYRKDTGIVLGSVKVL